MDQNDNDLQGSDGSGSLGGPDVRRRIPIKLISKQPLRKPPTRPPRSTSSRPFKPPPGDEENFVFKKEEKFDCGAKAGDVFGSQRRFPQQLFWDYKLNLIGEKDDIPVHFCDKCGLPIHIYGRMIPCKHVFCYECALLHEKKGDKMCPGLTMYNCTDPVQRIEQSLRGALYMCSIVPGCKRTYLSQRDLQAHVNHRHLRAAKSSGPGGGGGRPEPGLHLPPGASSEVPERFRVPPPHLNPNKNHGHLPAPLKHGGGGGHGDPYGQPPPPGPHDAPPPSSETFRISTVTTRQHSNLITVPIIQDDSASSSSSAPPPRGGPGGGGGEPPSGPGGGPPQGPPGSQQQQPPPPPPHHHPGVGEYPGQPPGVGVPPHSHHMMAPPPPQQHYGPPPPPPPPISHPGMQHGPPPSAGPGPPPDGAPHGVRPAGGPAARGAPGPAQHPSPGAHHGPDAPLHEPPAAPAGAAPPPSGPAAAAAARCGAPQCGGPPPAAAPPLQPQLHAAVLRGGGPGHPQPPLQRAAPRGRAQPRDGVARPEGAPASGAPADAGPPAWAPAGPNARPPPSRSVPLQAVLPVNPPSPKPPHTTRLNNVIVNLRVAAGRFDKLRQIPILPTPAWWCYSDIGYLLKYVFTIKARYLPWFRGSNLFEPRNHRLMTFSLSDPKLKDILLSLDII